MKQYEDHPLILTTPPMRDHLGHHRVRDAQYTLTADNHFKQSFGPGHRDGVYGRTTAGAVKRAKDGLGYPKDAQDTSYGQALYEYLTGVRKLPLTYRVRRRLRLREQRSHHNVRSRAVAIAHKEALRGVYDGGTNNNPYGIWYGWNHVAWCAIFTSYCWIQAGLHNVFVRGSFSASVAELFGTARDGHRSLRLTTHPEPGDLAPFGNDYHHIGMFHKWLTGNTFESYEGNHNDRTAVVHRSTSELSHGLFIHVGA